MLDDVIQIADGKINLVGRLDEEKPGDGTKNRKPLDELLSECDMNKPVIVINHEPDKLRQNAQAGVDVLLSGHTHAGQFFPLTIVQPFAWENYYGVKKIDNMYSVVTVSYTHLTLPTKRIVKISVVYISVTNNKRTR